MVEHITDPHPSSLPSGNANRRVPPWVERQRHAREVSEKLASATAEKIKSGSGLGGYDEEEVPHYTPKHAKPLQLNKPD